MAEEATSGEPELHAAPSDASDPSVASAAAPGEMARPAATEAPCAPTEADSTAPGDGPALTGSTEPVCTSEAAGEGRMLPPTPPLWKQGDTLPVVPEELDTVHALVADVMEGRLDPAAEEEAVNVELRRWVERHMQADHVPEEAKADVNARFQDVYGIVCRHLCDTSKRMPPAVLLMWQQLMLSDPKACHFFNYGGYCMPDSDEAKAVAGEFGRIADGGSSWLFVDNMQVFGRLGGYEAVLNRLRSRDEVASPLTDLAKMVELVCICRYSFNPDFGIPYIKQLVALVRERVGVITAAEAASLDLIKAHAMIRNVHASVELLCPDLGAAEVRRDLLGPVARAVLACGVLDADENLLEEWVALLLIGRRYAEKDPLCRAMLRDPRTRDPAATELGTGLPFHNVPAVREILEMLHLLPRPSLKSLNLGFEVQAAEMVAWAGLFAEMPGLTSLSVGGLDRSGHLEGREPQRSWSSLATALSHLPALTELSVRRPAVIPVGQVFHFSARCLADALLACTSLRRLSLGGTPIVASGMGAILASLKQATNGQLEELNLSINSWEPHAIMALADLLVESQHLRKLNIDHGYSDSPGVTPEINACRAALCRALPVSLTHLDVTYMVGMMTHLGPELGRLSRLEALAMAGGGCTYDGSKEEAVLAALPASRLRSVVVGAGATPALMHALPLSVTELELNNGWSEPGQGSNVYQLLAGAMDRVRPRKVALSTGLQSMTKAQAASFGASLRASPRLLHLSLVWKGMWVKPTTVRAVLLQLPPSLEVLELHTALLGVPIVAALPNLRRLKWVTADVRAPEAREPWEDDWSFLPRCPQLTDVSITCDTTCADQHATSLATVLAACPQLRHVTVSNGHGRSTRDTIIKLVSEAPHCRHLRTMDLSGLTRSIRRGDKEEERCARFVEGCRSRVRVVVSGEHRQYVLRGGLPPWWAGIAGAVVDMVAMLQCEPPRALPRLPLAPGSAAALILGLVSARVRRRVLRAAGSRQACGGDGGSGAPGAGAGRGLELTGRTKAAAVAPPARPGTVALEPLCIVPAASAQPKLGNSVEAGASAVGEPVRATMPPLVRRVLAFLV